MGASFRLGMRDGAMMALGFWLGLTALSSGVDAYQRARRELRHANARRKGFRS